MNINQLPENHRIVSSMVNPFDANEELFFVTHPNVSTYYDLDIWFCDMGTGDARVVEPYRSVSDTRLYKHMEFHIEVNSVNFIYPRVILPLQEIKGCFVDRQGNKKDLLDLPITIDSLMNYKIDGTPNRYFYRRQFLKELAEAQRKEDAVSVHAKFSNRIFHEPEFFDHFTSQKPGGLNKKPNRNLDVVMGLLKRNNACG